MHQLSASSLGPYTAAYHGVFNKPPLLVSTNHIPLQEAEPIILRTVGWTIRWGWTDQLTDMGWLPRNNMNYCLLVLPKPMRPQTINHALINTFCYPAFFLFTHRRSLKFGRRSDPNARRALFSFSVMQLNCIFSWMDLSRKLYLQSLQFHLDNQ